MSNQNQPSSTSGIDLLHWDVRFALKYLTEQVFQQKFKFLFVHSDRKLFDTLAFTHYLEVTDIKNFERIKDIYHSANSIINLNNGAFFDLVKNTPDEPYTIDVGEGGLKISKPFECYRFADGQLTYIYEEGFLNFFTPIRPTMYHSSTFAHKCDDIINTINAFYPEFTNMNFYMDIVNDLYLQTTDIDGTHFSDPFEFLEIKHGQAQFKGKVFYENITTELVKHWRAKMPLKNGEHFSEDCLLFVQYCKDKIVELTKSVTIHPTNLSINSKQASVANKIDLISFFESISRYNHVMNLFVEKRFCQVGTYLWKDELKGNKSLVAAIIKDLHIKGYFKSNTKPTHDDIKKIAYNTFGLEISLDTIKRAKPDNHFLDYIPLASTLP